MLAMVYLDGIRSSSEIFNDGTLSWPFLLTARPAMLPTDKRLFTPPPPEGLPR